MHHHPFKEVVTSVESLREIMGTPSDWSSPSGMASLAQILVDQIKPENTSVEELEKQIAESYATRLY